MPLTGEPVITVDLNQAFGFPSSGVYAVLWELS